MVDVVKSKPVVVSEETTIYDAIVQLSWRCWHDICTK